VILFIYLFIFFFLPRNGLTHLPSGQARSQLRFSRNSRHSFFVFFFLTLLRPEDVNLLGDNADTMKGNADTLIDVSKEVDLEIK
jgi:hypothetical protein